MSETSHQHTAQSRQNISCALRQMWAERLKAKRLKKQFYTSWADAIAEAARRGGITEEELNWNSYERESEEIQSRKLQRAAERAKLKEMQKVQAAKRAQERAEKKAQDKAEKMARRVRKKMQRKLRSISRVRQSKMMRCKAKQKKEMPASRFSDNWVTLREVYNKDKMNGETLNEPLCNQDGLHSTLRLDIELIKEEQRKKAVSLADQIQAAKSKRMQTVAGKRATRISVEDKLLTPTYPISLKE